MCDSKAITRDLFHMSELSTFHRKALSVLFVGALLFVSEVAIAESCTNSESLRDVAKADIALLKSKDFQMYASRFLLPGNYSEERASKERAKLEVFLDLLWGGIGSMRSAKLMDVRVKIHALSVDGGDRVGWKSGESIDCKTSIQYEADFSDIGILIAEIEYVDFNDNWFIGSFSVGEQGKTSTKTKRLQSLGKDIVRKVLEYNE